MDPTLAADSAGTAACQQHPFVRNVCFRSVWILTANLQAVDQVKYELSYAPAVTFPLPQITSCYNGRISCATLAPSSPHCILAKAHENSLAPSSLLSLLLRQFFACPTVLLQRVPRAIGGLTGFAVNCLHQSYARCECVPRVQGRSRALRSEDVSAHAQGSAVR